MGAVEPPPGLSTQGYLIFLQVYLHHKQLDLKAKTTPGGVGGGEH